MTKYNVTFKAYSKVEMEKLSKVEKSLFDFFNEKADSSVDSMKSLNKKFALWESIRKRGTFNMNEKVNTSNVKKVMSAIMSNRELYTNSLFPYATLNGDGAEVVEYVDINTVEPKERTVTKKTKSREDILKTIASLMDSNGLTVSDIAEYIDNIE